MALNEVGQQYTRPWGWYKTLAMADGFQVKVIEVDSQGRINLSKKQANSDAPPVVSRRSENGKGPRQKKSWN